ncbi:hypothetical protein AB0758_36910 [Tolypothrix bouteillei VB521301_2]|uniref:hypothetical protein n=1 Tax=Tolypothrix bouteillei TaxID=1246981 RepID=UPI0038B54EE0
MLVPDKLVHGVKSILFHSFIDYLPQQFLNWDIFPNQIDRPHVTPTAFNPWRLLQLEESDIYPPARNMTFHMRSRNK